MKKERPMSYVGINMHTQNMTIAAVNDHSQLFTSQKIICYEDELQRFFH